MSAISSLSLLAAAVAASIELLLLKRGFSIPGLTAPGVVAMVALSVG